MPIKNIVCTFLENSRRVYTIFLKNYLENYRRTLSEHRGVKRALSRLFLLNYTLHFLWIQNQSNDIKNHLLCIPDLIAYVEFTRLALKSYIYKKIFSQYVQNCFVYQLQHYLLYQIINLFMCDFFFYHIFNIFISWKLKIFKRPKLLFYKRSISRF